MARVPRAAAANEAGHALHAGLLQLLFLVATLVLVYAVILPIGYLVYESVVPVREFTLSTYVQIFQRADLLSALVNSLVSSFAVALLSILLGTLLAYGVSRTNMWGKWIVRAAIITAIISPAFLITVAYVQIAGPNNGHLNHLLRWLFQLDQDYGPVNVFSMWAFVFLVVPGGTAFVYVQLIPAFRNMDPSLEEAARMVGCTPAWTAFAVTIPLMRPAILSGGLLAFSSALAIYGTAHILGLNVLTIAIREALIVSRDFSIASGLSVLVTVFSLLSLYLYRRATAQGRKYQTLGGRGFRPTTLELGAGRHWFGVLGIAFAITTAILPYTVMLLTSFYRGSGQGLGFANLTLANYAFLFEAQFIRSALVNSLMLAGGTATIVTIAGGILGYLIVKTRISGRSFLDYVAILPLGIAGTALAVGLIIMHLSTPFKSLALYGTLSILLLAYVSRLIAFGVRNSQSALIQINTELEEAARVHGASPLSAAMFVVLPLVKGALVYTWVLVFILAYPEISASVILRGLNTDVVSTALLDVWDGDGGLPVACALGVTILIIVGTPMLLLQALGGRSVLDSRAT
jgi:iron(III) transport system permease protein